MLSKRSDESPAAVSPAGAEGPSGWVAFFRSNWTIPLALLALWPLNALLHNPDIVDLYYRRIILLIGINVILAVSLQLINGISGQFSLGHAGFMAVGAYMAAYPLKERSHFLADPANMLLFFISLGLVLAIAGGLLYVIFFLIRRSGRLHAAVPSLLLLLLAAWFLTDVAKASQFSGAAPPYLVWSKLMQGLTSLFSSLNAHLAPPAARLSAMVPEAMQSTLCFLIALVGGGCCAAVAGLIVGLPTLRLRGDYLAIATLGFAEIIRVVILNTQALGGATGMPGVPRYSNFAWIFGAALITIICVWRLARSPAGRNLAAIREDEIAARAAGIDATYHKVLAFVVGAFFAGVAGGLFGSLNTYLNPNEFGFLRSVEIVVMVTLGGLGSISGAVATAAVLTLLPEMLRQFAEWRMILYSLLLIGMMLLRPQGLLGNREIWPPAALLRRWRRGRSAPAAAGEPGRSPTLEHKHESAIDLRESR